MAWKFGKLTGNDFIVEGIKDVIHREWKWLHFALARSSVVQQRSHCLRFVLAMESPHRFLAKGRIIKPTLNARGAQLIEDNCN